MILTEVRPLNPDVGLHHFECPRCDYTLQLITLESARPSDGWPVEERAPAAPLMPTATSTLKVALTWSDSMVKPDTTPC